MAIEIVDLPMQNCDFPSSYVSLPEGNILCYPHSCWLNPYESPEKPVEIAFNPY